MIPCTFVCGVPTQTPEMVDVPGRGLGEISHSAACLVPSPRPLVAMLVLFETPAGYALFKVLDKAKLAKAEDVYKYFDTVEHAQEVVKLKAFSKFDDTTAALAAATSICDGKLDKSLKAFLKEAILKGKEAADKVSRPPGGNSARVRRL